MGCHLLVGAFLAFISVSCGTSYHADSEIARSMVASPGSGSGGTVIATFGNIDQYDDVESAQSRLSFRMPTPAGNFARIGKFTVRTRQGQEAVGEAKYSDNASHVITLVVRRANPESESLPANGEQTSLGGVDGVLLGDPWNFQFERQGDAGSLMIVVYGSPDIEKSVLGRFVMSIQ